MAQQVKRKLNRQEFEEALTKVRVKHPSLPPAPVFLQNLGVYPSFGSWLAQHPEIEATFGRAAVDAQGNRRWPSSSEGIGAFRRLVRNRGGGIDELVALDQAWRRYRREFKLDS